jgi:hypothetical protein
LVLLAGLITSPYCLYWFSRRPFVEPSPNNRLVANSRIPVENLFEMDWFWLWNRLSLNSRFFNPIWIDYYSLTKVFKGKPFISRPISSLLTLRKNFFRFSTPLCTIRPYTVRVAKYYWAWKVHRTKPQHRCFTHATIQHPVLVQPRNLVSTRKRFSKIWIHRGQWSLIENFRQKRIKSRF